MKNFSDFLPPNGLEPGIKIAGLVAPYQSGALPQDFPESPRKAEGGQRPHLERVRRRRRPRQEALAQVAAPEERQEASQA